MALSKRRDSGQFRGVRPTPWDTRAAVATFALGALLFAVACIVTGATDEGSITWTTRVLRTLPLVPACGGVVTYLTLRRAQRRGEMLALAAIGCSPARAAVFAVVGAAVLSAAAAAVVITRGRDATEAFFPRATSHADVTASEGAFVDEARGLRIASSGEITTTVQTNPEAPAHPMGGRDAAAAGILVLLGIALPLIGARAMTIELWAAGVTCVLCIFLLQAAAAGRIAPLAACVPALSLLIAAGVRYRSPAW